MGIQDWKQNCVSVDPNSFRFNGVSRELKRWELQIRYLGVIRFVFHVVQPLLIRFTQQILCYSKSSLNHEHKSDQKSELPWFFYGYRKWLFVDSFSVYISPPNCVHCLSVDLADEIWRRSPISFKRVRLWCLFCDPYPTTHQPNIGVRWRKGTKRTP
jgi:hypothetical protein